jgi:hypothetical protein
MTIPPILKKYAAPAIIAALVLWLGLTIISSFNLRDDYSANWATWQAEKKANALDARDRLAHIAKAEATIVSMDKIDKAKDADIARKNAYIAASDTRISALDAQLANATTDAQRVPILTATVQEWKGKFSLAEGVISDQTDKIFSLTLKVKSVETVAADYAALYAGKVNEADACAAVVKSLERDLRRSRFTGKVKSGLILGAAVYLAVHFISGK